MHVYAGSSIYDFFDVFTQRFHFRCRLAKYDRPQDGAIVISAGVKKKTCDISIVVLCCDL
jgi:hypothetical protein